MNKELNRLLHEQRKLEKYHISMDAEFDLYRRIAHGDLEAAQIVSEGYDEGRGVLSNNSLRDEKYHTIILIALLTRFCIEAGFESEAAYALSDIYIRQIDVAMDDSQISEIKKSMVWEFAHRMHELKTKDIKTLQVKRGVEYIQKNLTRPLSSSDVGEALQYNSDYLSRLFKKEFGITLGDYILQKKCHAACYMLENSDETITEIAAFLGFASASHFIKRFGKCIGESPESYRKRTKIHHSPFS